MAKKQTILTFQRKAQYLADGGSKCPFCGSDEIEGGHMEVDGTTTWQEVTCLKCDESWQDIYQLSDVEPVAPAKDEKIAKFFVMDSNGDTHEYKTETAAVEAILDDFAEAGDNPVDEVWCENADGHKIMLGVNWKATLTPI
jgi:hypothetical protein